MSSAKVIAERAIVTSGERSDPYLTTGTVGLVGGESYYTHASAKTLDDDEGLV